MILIVISASILVHFLFYGQPDRTVFDEVHFGKFASGYITGEYFFDIHPPLGKLLISGAGGLAGFKPGFGFTNIGDQFPDKIYLALRFLPTLAGTLLPIVIFFLVLRLGWSRWAAFSAAMLIILDNALLTQSRLILLDSFLLLFGFTGLFFYLLYRQKQKYRFLFLAVIFVTLSLSIKWTGLTYLAIIGLAEFFRIFKGFNKERIISLLIIILVAPVIYYSVFSIHLGLLDKTGPGDAFMSPEFKSTLEGSADSTNQSIVKASNFDKFIELNTQMYKSNAGLSATHPYASKWYEWPLMIGFREESRPPIFYWNQSDGNNHARIYLIGNPAVWWLSALAMVYVIFSLIAGIPKIIRTRVLGRTNKIYLFFIFAYFFNLLPFIGVARVLFLYHYFGALIFAILALVFVIDQTPWKKQIFIGILAVSTLLFITFAPLSYGIAIPDELYKTKVWFKSWQ